MPKIIENLRERLMEEARVQVMKSGYSNMTIRSVAGACGVGVGTVYNYFASKDMMVAGFMLKDWQQSMDRLKMDCESCENPEQFLYDIYKELSGFMKRYSVLFHDKNAEVSYMTAMRQYHKQLIKQLAEPLKKFCNLQTRVSPEFLAEFIAESMLTWTLAGRSYEEINSILIQLF